MWYINCTSVKQFVKGNSEENGKELEVLFKKDNG
jgi:hypothetical protein